MTKITCDICGSEIEGKPFDIFAIFRDSPDDGRGHRGEICQNCEPKLVAYAKRGHDATRKEQERWTRKMKG